MNHISLFSGIGGTDLACEWLGIKTICLVEIDLFCQKVLHKHWPDVPIVKDVNNVEEIKGIVANAKSKSSSPRTSIGKVGEQKQEQSGGSNSESLILTAGFPCQPFSIAGRRKGAADNRYLWPQTLAVIESVKPDWVVLENVAGILSMVFPDSAVRVASQTSLFSAETDEIADYDTISGRIEFDLRQARYETVWLVVPTCAVNAPHRRDRVWVVAHTTEQRLQGAITESTIKRMPAQCDNIPGWEENWYEVATRFCRVDDGIPNRVDRLKALGNAIVPQQIYPILKAIAALEHGVVEKC